jgi:hypothetical protein
MKEITLMIIIIINRSNAGNGDTGITNSNGRIAAIMYSL